MKKHFPGASASTLARNNPRIDPRLKKNASLTKVPLYPEIPTPEELDTIFPSNPVKNQVIMAAFARMERKPIRCNGFDAVNDDFRGAPLSVPTDPSKYCSLMLPIAPMGAVRLSSSDRWKKRPRAVKYFTWKNQIQTLVSEACNGLLPDVPIRMDVAFYIAMTETWTKKKKKEMEGKPHRQKFDLDNLVKGLWDSMFGDDAEISDSFSMKRWVKQGEERIEIVMYYE